MISPPCLLPCHISSADARACFVTLLRRAYYATNQTPLLFQRAIFATPLPRQLRQYCCLRYEAATPACDGYAYDEARLLSASAHITLSARVSHDAELHTGDTL